MILGVCDWLSYKLGWGVTGIRIGFVIGVLFFGAGLGLYFVLWIVKQFSN